MTLDEAHALAGSLLGPAVRLHLFTGRTRARWGLATLKDVHDAAGNCIDWAEALGFLTPVTVRELALAAAREFAPFGYAVPENSLLRGFVPRGTLAAELTEGERSPPGHTGTPSSAGPL